MSWYSKKKIKIRRPLPGVWRMSDKLQIISFNSQEYE